MSTDTKPIRLSHDERKALALIRTGADVKSPVVAAVLRGVQKKHPELLAIVGPLGTYSPTEQLPYFGAKLTAEGIAEIDRPRGRWAKKGGES